ncbi:MAG: hypothetical protein EOM26_06600 [Alphaproteobacteria bacterium]|nr:hypothetical protein [Alphaproteobacteria bacterium]
MKKTSAARQTRDNGSMNSTPDDSVKAADKSDVAAKNAIDPLNRLGLSAARPSFRIQTSSGLKTLRITSAPADDAETPRAECASQSGPEALRAYRGDGGDLDEAEPVLMLAPTNTPPLQKPRTHKALTIAGTVLSISWVSYCVFYTIGSAEPFPLRPDLLGGFLAGVMAPPAIFWLIVSQIQRAADVHLYAESLRKELHSLIFPSEERSRIISKDIEMLCRQAAELSASSKAVLKAIHRARQGLRVEVRDFVGVAKKTEFHIDRLAETLNERAARLLALTDEIEQRTATIGDKAHAGAEAWDQATLTILERAGEMEQAMGKGADKILSAADNAKEKTSGIEQNLERTYDNLNDAVNRIAERLKDLSGEFDDHTKGLTEATDHVAEETARLGEQIQSQIADLEKITARTVDAMLQSSETIQDQQDALDKGAQAIADQAENIADIIRESVSRMNDAVDHAAGEASGITTRVGSEADKLRETVKVLSREAEAIEQAGEAASNRMSEALAVALSGAESISSAVRRAVDSLEKSTASARGQAEQLITQTSEHIGKLNASGEGNLQHIKAIVELLEKSRTQIEEASNLTDSQVLKLSGAVEEQAEKINVSTANLADRIESVRSALEEPLKSMMHAISDADGKHEQIEATLRRRVSDLNEASEKATVSAEQIRGILRGQAQEISTLSGQIAAHSKTINRNMEEQRDSLSGEVRGALDKIEDVRKALEAQASLLNRLAGDAAKDINRLEGAIASRCEEINVASAGALQSLEELDSSLDSKLVVLRERCSAGEESILSATGALERSAHDVEPVFLRAVDQAEKASDRFAALQNAFRGTTESSLAKLHQIGSIFDERLRSLSDGSEQAAQILKSSSDHLQERVGEISDAARSASEKMRDIEASLENQSSDIHLVTDQALLKIEGIQKAINDQFHELSASIGQAVVQLQAAGNEFAKSSETVEDTANQIVSRFDDVGRSALRNSEVLGDSAQNTVETTSLLVSRVQAEAEELLEKSSETLVELKKAGDTFAVRSREIAEQMKVSLQISQNYGKELKAQAASVADASAESADRISKAISILSSKLDDVGKTAGDVSIKIEQSRGKLGDETERLITVSTKAIEATETATTAFGRQSTSLFKATEDASHKAEEIRKAESRVQREAFLSSAKFIVESLHSLSVDLTRNLDGEVPEKVWRAFQKGDVSAFTKRLAQLGDNMPVDKVRKKFASDTEFRTYVQRYLRQFEELYDQAVANDHGALLSSTFVSSEVGKLYSFLCLAAGREPRTSRDSSQAA